MNTRTVIVAVVSLIVGAAVGITGFIWFVGGNGAPSATLTAPTLDINALPTLNPTQAFDAQTQVAQKSAQVAELEATVQALSEQGTQQAQAVVSAAATAAAVEMSTTMSSAMPTAIPTEMPTAIPTDVPPTLEPTAEVTAETAGAAGASDSAARTLYRIDSTASQVTFTLQEDLRGQRIDVVGTTNEVAGDIIVDYSSPSASQIGTIVINARTLQTPEEMRNRAIRSRILQSANDAYEFIQFAPTAITGLPEKINPGETYTLGISGGLTLVGQSRPVTFDAQVTVDSAAQISGTASATITYTEWGIAIPTAPGVANVTPDVTLSINFVANQVEA